MAEAAEADIILNIATVRAHAVLFTEEAEARRSGLARCGWAFTPANSRVPREGLSTFHKDLCERCFPVLRGFRKRRLRVSAIAREAGHVGRLAEGPA